MRIFKRIALGLLGLVIVTAVYAYSFGLWIYDIPSAARALPATLAESKRLGLPMTAEELTAPLKVREERNAAIKTLEFAATLEGIDLNIGYAIDPYVNRPKTAELWDTLNRLGPDLDTIQKELGKPGWYVEREYDYGVDVLYPEYADLKRLARLYSVRAVLRAGTGDVPGTVADLTSIRHLRAHLSREPTLIALLVAIAIDNQRFYAIGAIANTWSSDIKKLDRLQASVDPDKFRYDPLPAFRGEFYNALATFRNLKSLGGPSALSAKSEGKYSGKRVPPEKLVRSGPPARRMEQAMLQPIVAAWNDVMADAETHPKPLRGIGMTMDRHARGFEESYKLSKVMAAIMLPVFSQSEIAMMGSDIRREAYKAMIEATKFKRRTGRWPADIQELGLAIPDPFAEGEPLRLLVEGDQVVVYSIGPNGEDDQGRRKTKGDRATDDFAAWLGTAPKD